MYKIVSLSARRLIAKAEAEGLALLAGGTKPKAWSYGIALAAFVPMCAYAQTVTGGASPATMVNNICTFILGTFGQSLAVLGIVGIGLSWMFGRASLGVVAGVVGGIIIMFGASYLGSTLTGGATAG